MRKIILAALIMFVLVSLTAVSAADINQTDDIAAEDSDSVTQDILSNESVGAGDFKELNDNLTSATATLELTKDYTYNPDVDLDYKNGINITKDITVDGMGYTIDGNNQSRVFNIVNAIMHMVLTWKGEQLTLWAMIWRLTIQYLPTMKLL